MSLVGGGRLIDRYLGYIGRWVYFDMSKSGPFSKYSEGILEGLVRHKRFLDEFRIS